MIARAFFELLTAGCLEVKEATDSGDRVRLYRAAPDIDLELLRPAERLVVGCLEVFRSFKEFLQVAASRQGQKAALKEDAVYISPQDACLLAEAGEVIDQAIEYLPPVCGCT